MLLKTCSQEHKEAGEFIYDNPVYEIALKILSSEQPRTYLDYFYDLSPPNLLTTEGQQLLAAVTALEGLSTDYQSYSLDSKYVKLSKELLKLRFESISVVVNSAVKLF